MVDAKLYFGGPRAIRHWRFQDWGHKTAPNFRFWVWCKWTREVAFHDGCLVDYNDREYQSFVYTARAVRYAASLRAWGQVEPVIGLYGVPRSPALYYFDDLVINSTTDNPEIRERKRKHPLWRVILTDHIAGVATAWARYAYSRCTFFLLGSTLHECIARFGHKGLTKCFANKRDAVDILQQMEYDTVFPWVRYPQTYNKMPPR